MKIEIDASPKIQKGETLVEFCTVEDRKKIRPAVTESEFSAKPNSRLHLHHLNRLFIGVGEAKKVDAHTLRSAAGTAVSHLKKIDHTQVAIDATRWPQHVEAIVLGAMLADYRYETFLKSKTASLKTLRCIVAKPALDSAKHDAARGKILAKATNCARNLGNQPGNVIYPQTLAEEAQRLANEKGLDITVLDETALADGKFGGLIAVGSGSARPPRLIVLEHRGGPDSQAPIALVGKAITFDSGGISIKPPDKMEEMIFDKCGGMAVLGAMCAIADLKLPRNVVGIIPSAENLLGGRAYRPGDIVTAYDGKYIEINNTDAEGRVVLADAIAYARKTKKASAIIDLATLTGAIGVALGEHAAGLFSSSDTLRVALIAASEKTGERLWHMPLFPEHDEQIKSDVALIKNSAGRLGGACTGAAFLKAFAEKTPWVHIDLAYTASIAKDRGDLARGATGYGVRTLVELVASGI
jgi:leucyl aminopeptidase